MYRGRFALQVTDLDDVRNAVVGDDRDDAVDASKRSARRSTPPSVHVSRAWSSCVAAGSDGAATERLANVVEELETLTRGYMREFIMPV
jgi:hypothetical protein